MNKNLLISTLCIASSALMSGCQKEASAIDTAWNNCNAIGIEREMKDWDESDRPSVEMGVKQGCDMLKNMMCKDEASESCTQFVSMHNKK